MAERDPLANLPASAREPIRAMAASLASLPGITAVALGGSHARGLARPGSDVDLGIYYREDSKPSVEALRRLAAEVDGSVEVTDFYDWGPWVNGGAWLTHQGQRIDWIYRELGKLDATLEALLAGRHELDWAQQPPTGFESIIYGGELHICRPLRDREGVLRDWKRRVASYPEALRRSVTRDYLRIADFTLMHARRFAAAGDVMNTTNCLSRTSFAFQQALFAMNRVWFVTEKTALVEIERFVSRPEDFASAVEAVLSAPGSNGAELSLSVENFVALFREIVGLSDQLYEARFV